MNGNRNQNRNKKQKPSFNEDAKNYIDDMMVLIDMENNSAEEIKNALKKLDKAIELMKYDKYIVKTHQLRTIYNLLRNVDDLKELYALIPKLKYIASRQKGKSGKFVADLIVGLIEKIENEDQIKGLVYVMESIIAFHKYHHGEK